MSEQDTTMNLDGRWPDLFEPLTPQQRRAVVQVFAASWHEGWEPNREDVQNLVDETTGAIDAEEYERRVLKLARERAAAAHAL